MVVGALACGGGHAGGGAPDAGAGGTEVTPPLGDGGVPDGGPGVDCDGVMPAPAGSALPDTQANSVRDGSPGTSPLETIPVAACT